MRLTEKLLETAHQRLLCPHASIAITSILARSAAALNAHTAGLHRTRTQRGCTQRACSAHVAQATLHGNGHRTGTNLGLAGQGWPVSSCLQPSTCRWKGAADGSLAQHKCIQRCALKQTGCKDAALPRVAVPEKSIRHMFAWAQARFRSVTRNRCGVAKSCSAGKVHPAHVRLGTGTIQRRYPKQPRAQ